jgi:hypothetical protein
VPDAPTKSPPSRSLTCDSAKQVVRCFTQPLRNRLGGSVQIAAGSRTTRTLGWNSSAGGVVGRKSLGLIGNAAAHKCFDVGGTAFAGAFSISRLGGSRQ